MIINFHILMAIIAFKYKLCSVPVRLIISSFSSGLALSANPASQFACQVTRASE